MMRLPHIQRLCTCALAGETVEYVLSRGASHCRQCGASAAGIMAARAKVQADWTAGGPGFRPAPRTFLGSLWSAPGRYRLAWAS